MMLGPVPRTRPGGRQPPEGAADGQPLRDTELLTWCREIIQSVLADLPTGAFSRADQRA